MAVTRTDHDGFTELVLDRPQRRNAFTTETLEQLREHLRTCESPLLLTGAGEAFCAGADLGDFLAMRGDEPACVRFRETIRDALDRLRDLAIPTVAAVEGACYGAGVALAMACDLRVAGRNARFAITPAKIGVGYPQEDIHRLVALVGPGQAARLLFTAQSIDGAEAAEIGLVEYYEPDGGIGALIEAILGNARESLIELKRAIRLAAEGCRSDSGQDLRFDALLGGEEVAQRLEALRRS